MKIYELLEIESFKELRDEINIFTKKILDDYTQNISEKAIHSENKEMKAI